MNIITYAAAMVLLPAVAHAADVVVAAPVSLDLTAVSVAVVGGIFAVIKIVAEYYANSRIKDATARAVVASALDNALGAIQQASQKAVINAQPHIPIPGVAAGLVPGVQYVLDHAGDEAARLGITPTALADKLDARLGLANIATNLAVSGSPAPVVVKSTDAVPVVVPMPIAGV